MQKLYLGHNGETLVRVMNQKEYIKFMSNKQVYHHEIYWIEKWEYSMKDLLSYFPYQGFTLPKHVRLERYYPHHGYSEKCLDNKVQGKNKYTWNYQRFKVTIRKTKNTVKYYVTQL